MAPKSQLGCASQASGEQVPAARSLTPAERQAVALAARGLSNRVVAELRGATTHTIANQLHAAYRKLGVNSRRELRTLLGIAPQRVYARPAQTRTLSVRELEVLSFVERGQSNKLIAFSLGVALSTVSTTVTRARRKLGPGLTG